MDVLSSMHHLPRFLVHSKRTKDMDRKRPTRKPKLERRNAAKRIEYNAASSSSSWDDSSGSLYTRSLDETSFRIEGTDGEFDRICSNLGLSGPEDFAIPAAAWEAMKLRSSSDILPMTKALDEIHVAEPVEMKRKETTSEPAVALIDGFEERVSLNASHEPAETSGCCVAQAGLCPVSVGVGIKGFRPPLLKPPPSMRLPVLHSGGSTWDLVRDLAPQGETRYLEYEDEEKVREDREENEHDEDEAAVVREADHGVVSRREENGNVGRLQGVTEGSVVLSEACFTPTSNDDDSSSSTTEPFSNISPIGRFRRIITNWQKGELLGRGSFGSVYEGIADDGIFFALKEVSLLDDGSQGRQSIFQLEQEIALLSQFEHENIVQYYGTDKDESKLYIFLELVTKGSLANLYRKYHLRDSQVSAYTRQILRGLKYLHDQNVVHRDIKCANILVDANGSVKLADFGLAKATKLNDVKSCRGTAFWMAPEVVRGKNQGYGLPADIWSLGCTVLEMLTGQIPYAPLECMQALYRIGKGEPPPVADSLSRDARDFIMQCLQVNPDNRLTAADLLDHSFVRRPLTTSSGHASPYHTSRSANVSP